MAKSQQTSSPKKLFSKGKASFAPSTALRASGGKKPSFADLFAATSSRVPALRRNQEVSGKIVSVSPQEVLVDIGAKSEGILAGRELDLARDILENLSVGDALAATVLYPENDAGQVVLSLKKLSDERRWKELEDSRDNQDDIDVSVLEVNRGGVICEFRGIRGFLPASQLLEAPSRLDDLIGKSLSARVIEVDKSGNRLILSQKSPEKKDIKEIAKLLEKIKIGDNLSGLVSAVLPFGIFVEINLDEVIRQSGNQVIRKVGRSKPESPTTQQLFEPEPIRSESHGRKSQSRRPDSLTKLEGLVHISEISWEKVEDPAQYFKVGDNVGVIVIAKEESTGRLNLSIKQLVEDPFLKISENYTHDKEVKGTVSRVTPYGVIVELSKGIDGLIHISKIPPNENFEVGQSIQCSVEAVDTKARKISLVPIVREKPVLYR